MVFKMDKYQTFSNFTNSTVGVTPILEAVVHAVPPFFPVILFMFFILGSAGSYFAILQTTGRKRFWHSLTAMSFITFIASLLISAMNTTTTTFLSGYWIGFYILMTLVSWFLLTHYK